MKALLAIIAMLCAFSFGVAFSAFVNVACCACCQCGAGLPVQVTSP